MNTTKVILPFTGTDHQHPMFGALFQKHVLENKLKQVTTYRTVTTNGMRFCCPYFD